MEYRCELCGWPLEPHGEAGMKCATGHHYLKADVERTQTPTRRVRKREKPIWPLMWVGAACGALALLIELLDLVI